MAVQFHLGVQVKQNNMKDNRIKFDNEAVSLLKTGVDKLANAVKSTLGPSGKNVIIIKEDGTPSITKDGVSVAKAINLEDKFENAGAQIVKEVAEKTLKNIGDNTTTATVLAQSFINNGLKKINKFSLIRRYPLFSLFLFNIILYFPSIVPRGTLI